jgi:CheY-like chemotaxis protein/PAS domain-containing protein
VAQRLRILVLGSPGPAGEEWLRQSGLDDGAVRVDSWSRGLSLLGREHFDLVLTSPDDASILDSVRNLLQSQRVLATLPDGVALVDAERKVRWANPVFESWCGASPLGRDFYEALGSPRVVGPEASPFRAALARPGDGAAPPAVTARLEGRGGRHLDLHITPVSEPGGGPALLIAVGRDVTALVQEQQKLDALHKAGQELAGLAPEQLAEMSVAERVELLKRNILRFTHDLLHYEVVEIRLLDPRTGRLEPLLQEGMIPEAAGREIRVGLEGQGVTGYVAATGKSYVCDDTACDAHYLPGAPGAHSSLTVPLIYRDKVIGTFNVESCRPHNFGEQDVQFAELFSHEIAAALHTLDLLSAEKQSTATQSVEAVNREVALPVDDILAAATSVLERYIGHDPEMADKLRKVLAGARSIKACIQRVGENMAPAPPASPAGPAAPPSLKGLRVLVADNDDRVRRSAHGLLGRWGCVVETARDAQEAVTMARLSTYDAVLADIRLPGLGGYELYRRLREAQPKAQVILMTGYGYDPSHTLVKARQDGLRRVLFKPFRVDQLLDALANPDPAAGNGKDGGPPAPLVPAPTKP